MIECYKCLKLGHFQYECSNSEENAIYVEGEEDEEMLLMALSDAKEISENKVWYLDSGYSSHICGVIDWFYDLDFRMSIKLGDNSKMLVMGKRNVKLQIGGLTQVITDVYYIPNLKNSHLSTGQL